MNQIQNGIGLMPHIWLFRKTGLCALLATLMIPVAVADVVRSPISMLNNELGTAPLYDIAKTFDQSGLSTGYTSGTTDTSTYLAGSPTHDLPLPGNSWLSATGTTLGNIDFDLGDTYNVRDFIMWDLTQSGLADIQDFEIHTSNVSNFSTFANVGSFSLNDPADLGLERPYQSFDLTDTNGRYVRLKILSNVGGVQTGFSELAFSTSAVPTPEPSTFAVIGLTSVAFLYFRRRSSQRSAAADEADREAVKNGDQPAVS